MQRFLELALVCLCLGCLARKVFADDVDLEKIVITASKFEESFGNTSRKVDVVTSKEMQDEGATDVASAITNITSVNIITKSPPSEKQKADLYTSFGTFRTYDERFSYGSRISNFGYLFSGGYKSSNGFRENTMFNSKDLNSKFEYKINDSNDLSLSASFYKGRAGAGGSTIYPDKDDKQVNLKNSLDLNWNYKLDETTQTSAKIYNAYDRLEFIENTAGTSWDIDNKKDIHTTKSRGLDFQSNKKLFDIYQLVLGFNYVGNYNDSTSSAKHKYLVRAWYIENQLEATKNLKLNLGARYDDYSNFGGKLNPSFSPLYKVNPKNKINLSVARSFRAPTFNDLYWPNDGWSAGNPNLKPEKSYTGEIGYESEINKYLTSAITYYHSKFSQLIIWETDPITWFSTPNNIGSAKIDGIEFNNKISPFDNFEIDLGYTYLLPEDIK